MPNTTGRAGDFTGLASEYSQHRPDYCASVLNALLGLFSKPVEEIDFIDLGAGTGIWTRMVQLKGVRSVTAVEPNDDMRTHGIADSSNAAIQWVAAKAEQTELPGLSCDWVTMASSFHWVDFDTVTRECWRLLRSCGRFTALWNPRVVDTNPLLVEIEDYLRTLCVGLTRRSSGLSGITEDLTRRLRSCPYFEDVVYIEGRHVLSMTPARYLGAWRSVNDLQVQMGVEKFTEFLAFTEDRIKRVSFIEAEYLTRAWSARRKD